MRPRVAGCAFDHALARRGAPIQTGQTQMDTRFVDKFQPTHKSVSHLGGIVRTQLPHARRVPLASVKRLFFNGSFKICKARHIWLGWTWTRLALTRRSQSSASVASGCWRTAARIQLPYG